MVWKVGYYCTLYSLSRSHLRISTHPLFTTGFGGRINGLCLTLSKSKHGNVPFKKKN